MPWKRGAFITCARGGARHGVTEKKKRACVWVAAETSDGWHLRSELASTRHVTRALSYLRCLNTPTAAHPHLLHPTNLPTTQLQITRLRLIHPVLSSAPTHPCLHLHRTRAESCTGHLSSTPAPSTCNMFITHAMPKYRGAG